MGKHIALSPARPAAQELGGANPPPADPMLRQTLERVPLRDDAFRTWKRFAFWTVMAMKVVARVAVRIGRQLTPDDLAKIVRVDPLETSSCELTCTECGMKWTPCVRAFVQADGGFSEDSGKLTGDFFVVGATGVTHKVRLACSNAKRDKQSNAANTCHDNMKEVTRSTHGLTWAQAKAELAKRGVAARLPGQR